MLDNFHNDNESYLSSDTYCGEHKKSKNDSFNNENRRLSDSSSSSSISNSNQIRTPSSALTNHESFPTPSTDHNNSDSESSTSCSNQNYDSNPANFYFNNEVNLSKINNYFNGYPIQQYLNSNKPPNVYTNTINNNMAYQNYDMRNYEANFNLYPSSSNNAAKKSVKEQTTNDVDENEESEAKDSSTDLIQSSTSSSYLMQPPDSDLIAAATSASRNRSTRRTRTKYDKRQLDILEATFQRTHYPDANVVDRLSSILSLSNERISVWFQNRRAKFKKTKKEPGNENIAQTNESQEDALNFVSNIYSQVEKTEKENIQIKSKPKRDQSDQGNRGEAKNKNLNQSKNSNESKQDGKESFENSLNESYAKNEEKPSEYSPSTKSGIKDDMEAKAPNINLNTNHSYTTPYNNMLPYYHSAPPQFQFYNQNFLNLQDPYALHHTQLLEHLHHQYQPQLQQNSHHKLQTSTTNELETLDQSSSSKSTSPAKSLTRSLSSSSSISSQQAEKEEPFNKISYNGFQQYQIPFLPNSTSNILNHFGTSFAMANMNSLKQNGSSFSNTGQIFQPYVDSNYSTSSNKNQNNFEEAQCNIYYSSFNNNDKC